MPPLHCISCANTSLSRIDKEEMAEEMAQRLRALAALPEVLSSIPSNHMVAHNHLIYNEIWCFLLACRNTCRQNTVYIINKS